ncbi:DUF2243 domain-containing protein [Cellulomonas fengjieae]|uniref:DUF2243 domain-containing protein n=1 Tax=Cellulomonas fengjieae TaxID=2819978 RepID=A0ABS3SLB2_9CELL|nr:DUF2243 domain-containing protein [Cellulomonas fengjieae]MBO3085761.1 DUF2243 domain-containing protein [Cellulomonas fengjieae]QVI67531.1 DUF2243 domain-containing protein [Cellulomonas fengjieae]
MTTTSHDGPADPKPPSIAPGLILGLGLGGFIDGIVIHQLLQWHHMVSHTPDHPMTTLEGLEANTFADGLFHSLTWVFVVLGMLLTLVAWRRGRLAPTWRFQIGLLVAGWGIFNLVEGIIDHHILELHHVRDDLGGPLVWDLGFLAFGAALLVGGWALHVSGRRALARRSVLA